MNKKVFLKLVCLFIVLISFLMIVVPTGVEAEYSYSSHLDDSDWKDYDTTVSSVTNNVMLTIVSVIRIVGTGVSIIMLTYVAIKYMSAAPQEKAEFKKSATAMVVGAIVLFGTTQIIGVISKFATDNIVTG